MKKRTRKLMENISKVIKYYYPFLNESEHAKMFDNFIYNTLNEAISTLPMSIPEPETDAEKTIKNIVSPGLKYGADGQITPSSVAPAIAAKTDELRAANIKPEHVTAFKKDITKPKKLSENLKTYKLKKKKIK